MSGDPLWVPVPQCSFLHTGWFWAPGSHWKSLLAKWDSVRNDALCIAHKNQCSHCHVRGQGKEGSQLILSWEWGCDGSSWHAWGCCLNPATLYQKGVSNSPESHSKEAVVLRLMQQRFSGSGFRDEDMASKGLNLMVEGFWQNWN